MTHLYIVPPNAITLVGGFLILAGCFLAACVTLGVKWPLGKTQASGHVEPPSAPSPPLPGEPPTRGRARDIDTDDAGE